MYCICKKNRIFPGLFEIGKIYFCMWVPGSNHEKLWVNRGNDVAENRIIEMSLVHFHCCFKAIDKHTGKTFFLLPPVKPSSSYTPKISDVFPAPHMDGGCGDGGGC